MFVSTVICADKHSSVGLGLPLLLTQSSGSLPQLTTHSSWNILISTLNPPTSWPPSNQDIDPSYSESDPTPTETDYYYTLEEEAAPQPDGEVIGHDATVGQVNLTLW